MDRRAFLKSAAGAAVATAADGLATPAISQRAAARTLRFIPQANLANFDPIWGTQYVVRNAAALVWDTLYGVDENLKPQRQMVEAEEVSSDGLTWTFRLRPSLKFHDGEKVLAKDVVASLKRWTVRDAMGQMIKAIEEEITATNDRTLKWVLGTQKTLPEDAVRTRQEQYAGRLRDAGADRHVRSVQADFGLCRQRTDALRQERMGARRQGGFREIRRLRAAPGTSVVARRRQAHAG
jgi:Bacterial extracellular solute-binding proteins, family 5 Middle